MPELKNIDQMLFAGSDNQVAPVEPVAPPEPEHQPDHVAEEQLAPETQESSQEETAASDSYLPEHEETEAEEPSDQNVDEYGTPIQKERTYTETEVQQMIRDRLSRGKHNQDQSTHDDVREAAEGFKADPNSTEPWDVQLGKFIDYHLDVRDRKRQRSEWEHRERETQAEFEAKFNTGMNRYKDFREVVAPQPITEAMMLATRTLEDPAAFIYAASKLHANELGRISRLRDPYQQATEIGRLESKMRKERNVKTKAARPIETPKGDMPQKMLPQRNLDQMILSHAKQKQGNRR